MAARTRRRAIIFPWQPGDFPIQGRGTDNPCFSSKTKHAFTMKILRHLLPLVALSALFAASVSALAAETKKPKPAKTEATKPKGKPGKEKKKAEPSEVQRAEEMLKELPAAKRTALTKLLNTGTKEELTALPGIGEATADAILKARPLESAASLVTVKGVGEKTFSEIVKSRK
jgi:DNA uptake protein ComE-like DNA-binding protein